MVVFNVHIVETITHASLCMQAEPVMKEYSIRAVLDRQGVLDLELIRNVGRQSVPILRMFQGAMENLQVVSNTIIQQDVLLILM